MATVLIRQNSSQSASRFRSSVNVAKERTGSLSRSAATATKISVAPISTPAACGFNTGGSAVPLPFILRFLLWAIPRSPRFVIAGAPAQAVQTEQSPKRDRLSSREAGRRRHQSYEHESLEPCLQNGLLTLH